MMEYTYQPKGVCSRAIHFTIDERGVVTSLSFRGGCGGNAQGLAALVIGQKASEIADKLQGIDCEGRGTSCPDQLSKAIRQALGK